MNLHERIAKTLGWSVQDTQSCSLPTLRELVRPVSPPLAYEISQVIQSGSRLFLVESEPPSGVPST
jgi:hypothetical protein